MKGARALDCDTTIRNPSRTNPITIGISQYFFSCRRNSRSSLRTRRLVMSTSEHPSVVVRITVSSGIRRPAGPPVAPARQWVLTGDTPHDRNRHEHQRKYERQQDPCIEVSESPREAPPHGARYPQKPWIEQTGYEQQDADATGELSADHMLSPDECCGDRA